MKFKLSNKTLINLINISYCLKITAILLLLFISILITGLLFYMLYYFLFMHPSLSSSMYSGILLLCFIMNIGSLSDILKLLYEERQKQLEKIH